VLFPRSLGFGGWHCCGYGAQRGGHRFWVWTRGAALLPSPRVGGMCGGALVSGGGDGGPGGACVWAGFTTHGRLRGVRRHSGGVVVLGSVCVGWVLGGGGCVGMGFSCGAPDLSWLGVSGG